MTSDVLFSPFATIGNCHQRVSLEFQSFVSFSFRAKKQSNAMGGAHLHTPQSIFQHMMGQQNAPHQNGPWSQMTGTTPMMMPWSIPSLQQSQLVRFTGERSSTSYGKTLHVKRKLPVPDVAEAQRAKQFITEEKMAAHFQDMHISNDYSQRSVASTSRMNEPQPCCSTSNDEIPIDLDVESEPTSLDGAKSVHPRLVISEELKKLHREPLLPGSLLAKLESRPSMALVLWEPPSKHLRMLSHRQDIREFSDLPNNNNNNDSSVNNNDTMLNNNASGNNNHEDSPDMNRASMEEQIELEPMDL